MWFIIYSVSTATPKVTREVVRRKIGETLYQKKIIINYLLHIILLYYYIRNSVEADTTCKCIPSHLRRSTNSFLGQKRCMAHFIATSLDHLLYAVELLFLNTIYNYHLHAKLIFFQRHIATFYKMLFLSTLVNQLRCFFLFLV